jgi:hypothetical protein
MGPPTRQAMKYSALEEQPGDATPYLHCICIVPYLHRTVATSHRICTVSVKPAHFTKEKDTNRYERKHGRHSREKAHPNAHTCNIHEGNINDESEMHAEKERKGRFLIQWDSSTDGSI